MKALVAATLLLSSSASAQVLEDFEHGNEALYVAANGGLDTMNIDPAAAHDGMFGAEFTNGGGPTWRSRLDLMTAPGNTYESYVRARGGSVSGRSYVGIGASTTGTFSAVFAPNTATIILQDNAGWGFSDLASAPVSFAPDTWYVLRHEWAANGDMTVHLLDESGTTTLASTATVATGNVTPGWISLRGFSTQTGVFNDVDTIRGPGGTIGSSYCGPAIPNSTGSPGAITGLGSAHVAANSLTLRASSLPHGAFGYFLGSQTQGLVLNPGGSQGNLCLGGGIGRFLGGVFNTGATGGAEYQIDLTAMPTPGGLVPAAPGQTWNFQGWYRDANPGVTSNFTDGLSVTLQ